MAEVAVDVAPKIVVPKALNETKLAAPVQTLVQDRPQWVVGVDNPIQKIPGEAPVVAQQAANAAEKVYAPAVKKAEKEGVHLPALEEKHKTGVARQHETFLAERQAVQDQRTPEVRANVDLWRQESARLPPDSELFRLLTADDPATPFSDELRGMLEAQLQRANLTIDQVRDIKDKQQAVREWDAQEPPPIPEEVASENQRLTTAQEKIKQNELLQRENLQIKLVRAKGVLQAPQGQNWREKVTAVQGMKGDYGNVEALTEQGVRLNSRRANLWGRFTGKPEWRATAEADAKAAAERRNKHPIGLEKAAMYKKPAEQLTDSEKHTKSRDIDARAKGLVAELNTIRQGKGEQPLLPTEEAQLRRNWGITESNDNGILLFEMESNSVMETLLVSEAIRDDATVALEANLTAVEAGDLDCVEAAVEAANLKVQGEAMSVIAQAMAVEGLKDIKTQEAIAAAQQLGLIDEATRLEKLQAGSAELYQKCREGLGKISTLIIENKGKIGKYALYGIGGAAILAIILALGAAMMASSAAGGRG